MADDTHAPPPTSRPLRPYQKEAVDAVELGWEQHRSVLIVMPTGCHAAGQNVIMFDGSVKRVEDVLPGDALMGPNSTPRRVLALARGRQRMAQIQPVKGEPWIVNLDHVLTLVRTNDGRSDRDGELVDVTVRDWLDWSRTQKHLHKLVRTGIEFHERTVPIVPYLLGVLLGDGALSSDTDVSYCKPDPELRDEVERFVNLLGMRLVPERSTDRAPSYGLRGTSGPGGNPLLTTLRRLGLTGIPSEERFVPPEYLRASRKARIELLAGLLDTDGSLTTGGYDWISKSPMLSANVAWLARSLGFAAYISPQEKWCQTGAGGIYHRVSISGDLSVVPCRIPRKQAPPRQQIKSVLRTGFKVDADGAEQDFFGFTLDGDGRYLLDDFTVTHNSGKTRCFSEVLLRRKPMGRSLVLAHRDELIEQATNAIQRDAGLRVDVEQAGRFADVDPGLMGLSDVVVASVQTLHERRLARWPSNAFATLVVDEAHHAPAASYRKILDRFPNAKILGVTATPDRSDETALRTVFDDCVYQYEIRTAIQDGVLCPIRQLAIACADLDLSQISTRAGDLAEGELEEAMTVDAVLHQIAGPLVREAGTRPTLVFTAGVEQAHELRKVLAGYTDPARIVSIDGETAKDARHEALNGYRNGRIQYLLNCAVLTEGFDAPETACVAMARPTKSRALYAQCLGRGTRIAPGKTDLLVLDFVGNAGRHSLVSVVDVLAGKPPSDEVKRRVQEKVRQGMDVEGALSAVERELEERARRERAAKAAKLRAQVQYTKQAIDPFRGLDGYSVLLGRARKEPVGVRRASDAQLELLRNRGVEFRDEEMPSARDAHEMIDEVMRRRRQGLCTYKQARLLMKNGLNPDLQIEEASRAIDALKQNGWKADPDMWERWGRRDER